MGSPRNADHPLLARAMTGPLIFLALCGALPAAGQTQPKAARNRDQRLSPLASQTIGMGTEAEVGLEIHARSVGASWAIKGAEAAALLIAVDGQYNQDLLLWAGDQPFTYRVMLGRLSKGKHEVAVTLNPARSAPAAQRVEILALRPLLFTPGREVEVGDATADDLFAFAHSPVLYARANSIDRFTDVPLWMYYEIEHETGSDVIVRYTIIFTDEDGGTPTAARMARWGRATDIEWVYQLRARGGKILEEIYQGVDHETKPFTGQHTMGSHPLLADASDNNNFSDLACSAVRFALLPVRARLNASSRESQMDAEPWTYRLMAEELYREKRISEAPADINSIADPRDYLYIEASAEQRGTALGFDARLKDDPQVYRSDGGDARLRIDRDGYFRTALRLPHGVTPERVSTITARCHPGTRPAVERACRQVGLTKVFTLDHDYVPRELQWQRQSRVTLQPGASVVFVLAR